MRDPVSLLFVEMPARGESAAEESTMTGAQLGLAISVPVIVNTALLVVVYALLRSAMTNFCHVDQSAL